MLHVQVAQLLPLFQMVYLDIRKLLTPFSLFGFKNLSKVGIATQI
ncbi:hypothetical protein ACT7DZ_06365 [Bacillus cereus]